MVYFEQRVIVPPDVLQRLDTFSDQLNSFLLQVDILIKRSDPVQLASLADKANTFLAYIERTPTASILNTTDRFLTQLEGLPAYVEVVDKHMEGILKHAKEVARVADRFADGLDMLVMVGLGILVALGMLIFVGCVLIRAMRKMDAERKREIENGSLKKREEGKSE
jgi:hypothetical protein